MPPRTVLNEVLDRAATRPLIAPSILSADFGRLVQECGDVLEAGADLLHLDVMDGHFVPNLTMGPVVCAALRKAFPNICLDVHLMVTDPAAFIRPFADAGASHCSVHIEAQGEPEDLAASIHQAGMTAGIAINPPTDIAAIMNCLGAFDLILIMSVNPGFAGQVFIESVLSKARHVRPRLRSNQRLEIDGGVNARTAADCVAAGCDVLVAASAIFGAPDYAVAIRELRTAQQSPDLVRPVPTRSQ